MKVPNDKIWAQCKCGQWLQAIHWRHSGERVWCETPKRGGSRWGKDYWDKPHECEFMPNNPLYDRMKQYHTCRCGADLWLAHNIYGESKWVENIDRNPSDMLPFHSCKYFTDGVMNER